MKPQNRPLRTLHLSTEMGFRGGEQQVRYLTDGLVKRGHVVRVLCPAESALFADRAAHDLAEPFAFRDGFGVGAALRLGQWVNSWKPDVIHAHTSHAQSLAWLAMSLRIITGPVVVTRRVDFPIGTRWTRRKKYRHSGFRYIAISQAVQQVLHDGGISQRRIRLVHSGIDPDRLGGWRGALPDVEARASWAVPSDVSLLANTAALTDHKDHATLLNGLAQLKQTGRKFRLIVGGQGELAADLAGQTKQLGLQDQVLWAGQLDSGQVSRLLRAADAFVLSSKLEGLGTSVLDAMAVGAPVVATAAGGIPEAVLSGKTGVLVPPGDAAALALGLQESLTASDASIRMAQAARDHVVKNFSHDAMIDGTIAAYWAYGVGSPSE